MLHVNADNAVRKKIKREEILVAVVVSLEKGYLPFCSHLFDLSLCPLRKPALQKRKPRRLTSSTRQRARYTHFFHITFIHLGTDRYSRGNVHQNEAK